MGREHLLALAPDRVSKALNFCRELDEYCLQQTNELARKIDVDPTKDLLIISNRCVCRQFGTTKIRLPHWMRITDLVDKDYELLRGNRRKKRI